MTTHNDVLNIVFRVISALLIGVPVFKSCILWFLARKWESIRFTRLSEKRRIRFSWPPTAAL
jgi:hypothetical protein